MTNTILVSHTVGISATSSAAATLEGTLWGDGAWANGTDTLGSNISTGTVDFHGDPAFVPGGNYRIGPGSDARNAGVPAGIATDIDGERRLSAPDLGADEYVTAIHLPLVLRDT